MRKNYFAATPLSRNVATAAVFMALAAPFFMTGCAKEFPYVSGRVKLTIDSISPDSGMAGQAVLIYGQGFSPRAALNKVYFNGVPAKIDSNASYNVLLAYAPAGDSSGPVSVVTGNDSVAGAVFTYNRRSTPASIPGITEVVWGGMYTDYVDGFFRVLGTDFDSLNSVVRINGRIVPGYTYSSMAFNSSGTEELDGPVWTVPQDQPNPASVTVTVKGVTSAPYYYVWYPQIDHFSVPTAQPNDTLSIFGYLFGNQTVPSRVRAFYYDGNANRLYLTPDPAILLWTTNRIQVKLGNYRPPVQYIQYAGIGLEVVVQNETDEKFVDYYEGR